MRILMIATLAACGGTAVAPAPTSNVATSEPKAVPYAALFEAATLTFPATLSLSNNDESVDTKGAVTCTISDVKPTADGKTANVVCATEMEAGDLEGAGIPSGVYAMRADGLWRLSDMPDVAPDQKLMDGVPVTGDVKQLADPNAGTAAGEDADAESYDTFEESVTVQPFETGWCFRADYSMHREHGSWSLCFVDGKLVGGHGAHSGYGASQDLTFGKASP